MDSSGLHNGHFKQYTLTWRTEFTQRQTKQYKTEQHIFYRRKEHRYDEQEPPILTLELVNKFIHFSCQHDLDRYSYRTLQLAEFLESADLETIRRASTNRTLRPTALLDDRNNRTVTRDNLEGDFRSQQDALTACQLYNRLSQPRTSEPYQSSNPDAERRLIYVTDLDPLCALALVATVSYRQVEFLRDFIHAYLASRALIGVRIPSPDFAKFSLECHIPYYAWRRMRRKKRVPKDRRSIRGKPLRRSEEVIHLVARDKSQDIDLKDYIHEAQISIMVTGIDDWFWTAYCFADVYFKDKDHPERVNQYAATSMRMDPLCCGKFELSRPVWNPRHYFLRALACRMEQVKQEWNNVIFQLFQEIEPCILSFTRGEADDLEITQRKGFRWTIRILRQFTHSLSKTIDAWETFKDGEIRYFYLPDSESMALPQESWGGYLASIDKNVTELRDLRSSLLHKTDLFENMTNSFVTHAAHDETIKMRLQNEFIRALTVITIIYLPPTLTSTIFSMQAIIPAEADLRAWASTLAALFFVTLALVFNLSGLERGWLWSQQYAWTVWCDLRVRADRGQRFRIFRGWTGRVSRLGRRGRLNGEPAGVGDEEGVEVEMEERDGSPSERSSSEEEDGYSPFAPLIVDAE